MMLGIHSDTRCKEEE